MVRKDRLEYREGLQVSFWNVCDLRIRRVANLVLGFYRQVLLKFACFGSQVFSDWFEKD